MRAASWGLGLCLLGACGEAAPSTVVEVKEEVADGVVGHVAAVKGTVWIKGVGGGEGKAAQHDEVRRSDLLRPDGDGFIVLVLKNSHVVKISAAMPVAKIAVLDAPESSTDLEQTLRSQLGSDYEAMIGKGKLQRIAGWNQSMAAGQVVAPEQKAEVSLDQPSTPVVPRVESPEPAEPADPEPVRNTPGAKKTEPKQVKKNVDSKKALEPEPAPPPNLDRPVQEGELQGAPIPRGWSFVTAGGEERRHEGLPTLVTTKWGELAGCVGGASELRLIVVTGGKITGVTPAACAAALLQQTLAEVQEAATVIVKLR